MNKVKWGILSTANIGVRQVIPAMQQGKHCEIVAIASRNLSKARQVATELGIPRAIGSYEELLADPEIEAVYIPLPNHMHVEWAIKALEAGKHVLCEKPIALSSAQAQTLADAAAAHPELKVMEAFMYRHHPQWQAARRIVNEGGIGELVAVDCLFSYYNVDPNNIRNQAQAGGGALMDIGCYCISQSRFIFGTEPKRIVGSVEFDPEFGTDKLASALLEFEQGKATFTCCTQMSPYQRVNIMGTTGRVEIEIPFNAPIDRPCRIWHQTQAGIQEIAFETCNQYTIQGDLFSLAILNDTDVPTPLTDAVANMKAIEAVFRSAETSGWVE